MFAHVAAAVFTSHVSGMQLIFNDIHFYFFFKSTYRPQVFGWVARETTNQFGMALLTHSQTHA